MQQITVVITEVAQGIQEIRIVIQTNNLKNTTNNSGYRGTTNRIVIYTDNTRHKAIK